MRNLEFTTPDDGTATSEANVIFTLTAAEGYETTDGVQVASGRTSVTDFDITFDVHLLPSVTIADTLTVTDGTNKAGVAPEISGITISDPDSDFLTVTVETDLAGDLYSVSTADYSTSTNSTTSVSFSGATDAVQDALDNLRFMADAAGDVTLSFTVDDNDTFHARSADGSLSDARASATMDTALEILASPPTISQSFEPFVKVGSAFWSGFSGIEVEDLDSDTVTVTISGVSGVVSMYSLTAADHGVSADGIYAYDADAGDAYSVSGAELRRTPTW